MAALSSCLSSKIFTRNTNKTVLPLTLLGRSDIGFSRSPTFKKLQFKHLTTKSHLAPEVTTDLENAVPDIPQIQTSRTTHVKFQLQKECMFGDQIFLVGDHPILGLWMLWKSGLCYYGKITSFRCGIATFQHWNPANAIPMNWSNGHIWNVELDIPIESTLQFKFILKQNTGEIIWQPGGDRIFKSWESKATVIIAEDWENPEAQKIAGEVESMIAGNVSNQREEKPMPNVDSNVMFSANTAYAEEKLNINSEYFSREISNYPVQGDMIKKSEEPLLGYEGQVLVPGLISTDEAGSEELGSAVADSLFGVTATKE